MRSNRKLGPAALGLNMVLKSRRAPAALDRCSVIAGALSPGIVSLAKLI